MSKNINVNPAHYKVAGRERQGEDIAQHLQKQAFGQRRAEVERWQSRQGQGAPGWEDPAQPTAEPEPAPAPARPKRARKAKPRRKPARARKSAASRAMPKKGRKSAAARRTVKRPRRSRSTR